MRFLVIRSITALILLSLIVMSTYRVDAATRTLEKSTRLIVAGSTGVPMLVPFRGGTEVVFNDFGEVTEGILAEVTGFCPPGYPDTVSPRLVYFKEGTRIILNSRGEVVRGTLAEVYDSNPKVSTIVAQGGFASSTIYNDREKVGFLLYQGPTSGRNSFGIPVKAEAEISFHDNGVIANCTLFKGPIKDDTLLRPVSWQRIINNTRAGFVKFQNNTLVVFNSNAEVVKGILDEDIKYKTANGDEKLLKAGTSVDFTSL